MGRGNRLGENVRPLLRGGSCRRAADRFGEEPAAALDAALHPAGEGQVTESGLVTSGEAAGGSFTITSDPETGSLLALEIPSAELKATFTNFSLKTA